MTLLAAQTVPSSHAKKLRVSHLQACDMANVLITSSCHPAEVIFKKEVKGELAVEHVWEDNSNWPPLLKIKLTEMSWKAYQAARQLGKQADENKDDEKKDNEEKAEDEASLAEHVDRSGAPRNAASKPVPKKSKAGPKTKAPAKSWDSWAALDRSSFKGRGWTQAGSRVLCN